MALVLPAQNAERPSDSSFQRPNDRDEMWEGVLVMSPIADFEHQDIVLELASFLVSLVKRAGLGRVFAGCNVSDRDEGWTENYRIPDVAVFLHDGVGSIHGSHSLGGPDFLVEVLSDDDRALEKLPFYAKNGVREALFIRRDPWAIELYRNVDGILTLLATSKEENPEAIACSVVPISLRVVPDPESSRPAIEITQLGGDLLRRI